MVLFLTFQSIATAVTYFLGRDIYAAVILQNFKRIVVAFPHHDSVGVVVVHASLSSIFFPSSHRRALPHYYQYNHLLEFEMILFSHSLMLHTQYTILHNFVCRLTLTVNLKPINVIENISSDRMSLDLVFFEFRE